MRFVNPNWDRTMKWLFVIVALAASPASAQTPVARDPFQDLPAPRVQPRPREPAPKPVPRRPQALDCSSSAPGTCEAQGRVNCGTYSCGSGEQCDEGATCIAPSTKERDPTPTIPPQPPASQLSNAQSIPFSCPKEGTVVSTWEGRTKYHGSIPNDPSVCIVTNHYGNKVNLIYGLWESDIKPEFRRALDDLFAGRTSTSTVTAWTSNQSRLYKYIYTRAGNEVVRAAGRNFDTMMIEVDRTSDTGRYHGKWMYWLSPSMGIWVKGSYTHINGIMTGQRDWIIQSITLP